MGKEFWGSDPVKADKMKSRIPLGKFAGKVLNRYLSMILKKFHGCKIKKIFFLSVPEDVVNGILFLLSEKSAMINGIVLPIDGGYSSC